MADAQSPVLAFDVLFQLEARGGRVLGVVGDERGQLRTPALGP